MKIASIVLYLVVTIAMITFIMLQRGTGANAGSGFGAGASGTVFGARGSANFLSSATKWLAVAFFALSLGMAVYETRSGAAKQTTEDLGVMGGLTPASETPAAPDAATSTAPTTTTGDVPAAPAASTTVSTAPLTVESVKEFTAEDVKSGAAPVPAESPDAPKPKEKQP